VPLPQAVQAMMVLNKESKLIPAEYEALRSYLHNRY